MFRMFCVGVSTSYTVISRLDRLMVAVKELVGEQYYIFGLGVDLERGDTVHTMGGSRQKEHEDLEDPNVPVEAMRSHIRARTNSRGNTM
jgi:hypothetical protein